MWLKAGVPSVRTMWSASAAAATSGDRRRRPVGSTWSSRSWVPVSRKGIWPAAIESRMRASFSTPITSNPQSANVSARGSPTRPRPMTATRCCMRGRLRGSWVKPLGGELPRELHQEGRVVVEVARQQSTRLLGNPISPLETAILHPRRRLRDAARMEVEGGPHGGHHRHVEPLAHVRHPLLLLRHADANPEDVRAVAMDACDQLVL